jgi:hypothetical protein
MKAMPARATHGATARRLQTQAYKDSAAFVPISVANATGDTAPLRIAVVWDVVTGGDSAFVDTTGLGPGVARQCGAVGQTIEVKTATAASGWRIYANGCTAKHLVTGAGGAARFAAMQARTLPGVTPRPTHGATAQRAT